MKIKSFSSLFSQSLFVIFSAITLVTLLKGINIIILTGSFADFFSQKLILQLLSIAIIPDIVTYALLIGTGYYFMRKNARLVKEKNEKNMEIARRQASLDTAQKMTELMIEVIGQYNNQIKGWIHKKSQKGEQAPQKVEHASTMIGRALHALTEFSYIVPYIDNTDLSLETAIEDIRMKLNTGREPRRIEAPA